MYYLAGTLPDPDRPYMPTRSNSYTWACSIAYELSLLATIIRFKSALRASEWIKNFQITLGGLRLLILSLMLAYYAEAHCQASKRQKSDVPGSERFAINRQGRSADYGALETGDNWDIHLSAKDNQSSGWFDYFIGFRVLFPYIWSVTLFYSFGVCLIHSTGLRRLQSSK